MWNGYLSEFEPIPIRRMQYFEECDEHERVETDVRTGQRPTRHRMVQVQVGLQVSCVCESGTLNKF